ncbi:hypothetical protein PPTG_12952 [Phytophthora nicotianae INRA-310]|uniref:Uncharacterized protein n=1 Tax=Phytophthora nicotianae (strain INRA-310) TaxID=761204 RepID=W2Q1I8_PHYN3|nr:hypothetical protein PPTG_12952 [Phytophthora nicotianae INRA-310]ETN06982.1 hypothetical protein PPTG_12952 [Phytophthora nicotianae INRA-310]
MAPATRKNDPDAPPGGERQAELEAQPTQLRAEITALQANNQTQRQPPLESKARVPSGLPKFKGKRDDDVRQWLFQVETLCRINGHNATDDNYSAFDRGDSDGGTCVRMVPVLGLKNTDGYADVASVHG